MFGSLFNWVFVFFLFSLTRPLYILNSSRLSVVSFANIFSQSVAYLLICLMLPFTGQHFLILMKPGLSIISFLDHKLSVFYLISHHFTQSHLDFLLGEEQKFSAGELTCRHFIPFSFIFISMTLNTFISVRCVTLSIFIILIFMRVTTELKTL